MRKYLKWALFLFIGILAGCIEKIDWVSDLYDERLTEALIKIAPSQKISFYELPDSDNFSQIPQDPNNALTPEKVALGKLLFHETGLSRDPIQLVSLNSYSCATCHHVGAGFQSGRVQGIGEGGIGFGVKGESRSPNPNYDLKDLDVQSIKPPSIINSAFQKVMGWNGRFGSDGVNKGTDALWKPGTQTAVNLLGYQGLESRAISAFDIHRLDVNKIILTELGYKDDFDLAFAYIAEANRYSKEAAGLAIAAYLRTVMANQSPFQLWLKGDADAMTNEEKRGALLFFGKANCAGCHIGPALSSSGQVRFYSLGMRDMGGNGVSRVSPTDIEHLGRGGYTGSAGDNYKFKVPQLYNLKDSPYYGHGGRINTLREVVEYKNKAIPANQNVPREQISTLFRPLGLVEAEDNKELSDLTAFVTSALRDPNLIRYVPDKLPSNLCFPNNDAQSKKDLGCN